MMWSGTGARRLDLRDAPRLPVVPAPPAVPVAPVALVPLPAPPDGAALVFALMKPPPMVGPWVVLAPLLACAPLGFVNSKVDGMKDVSA